MLAVILVGGGSSAEMSEPADSSGRTPSSSVAPSGEPTPSDPASASPAPGDAAPVAGSYLEWSPTAVADAEGRVLLFFHAPWCPQCRELDEDIRADGPPDGTTIIKVDYDSRQDLRREYGVTLQTTVVEVDASGALLGSVVPYDDPSLETVLAGLE